MHCHYDHLSNEEIKTKFTNQPLIAVAQSTSLKDYQRYLEIQALKIPNLYFGYGLYPDNVLKKDFKELKEDLEKIDFTKALVIGEIGMDKVITQDPFKISLQEKLFREQIEIAISLKKPIVVHTRGAVKESLEILKSYPKVKTMLHWFTALEDEILEGLSRGYYLTERFARPKIKNIENYMDQIFIETDLPVYYNGKETRIESIKESYEVFCKKYNYKIEDLQEKTINNFLKLFPTVNI
jgi:TatD DNase family protein